MSTFYATFEDAGSARQLVQELVGIGIGPDDVSLIVPGETGGNDATVGDASYFVGREDDPVSDDLVPQDSPITDKITFQESSISGIDTSNSDTNVESVDQMEDSQEAAEDLISPYAGISQGEHEADDLVLAVNTGFPTDVPLIDDVREGDTYRQDQMSDGFESIDVPGFGAVMGGGELSTVVLGFAEGVDRQDRTLLLDHLKDEGVPESRAQDLWSALRNGASLIAIEVTPGQVDEGRIERLAEWYGGKNAEMFDAPRYYDHTRAELL